MLFSRKGACASERKGNHDDQQATRFIKPAQALADQQHDGQQRPEARHRQQNRPAKVRSCRHARELVGDEFEIGFEQRVLGSRPTEFPQRKACSFGMLSLCPTLVAQSLSELSILALRLVVALEASHRVSTIGVSDFLTNEPMTQR